MPAQRLDGAERPSLLHQTGRRIGEHHDADHRRVDPLSDRHRPNARGDQDRHERRRELSSGAAPPRGRAPPRQVVGAVSATTRRRHGLVETGAGIRVGR